MNEFFVNLKSTGWWLGVVVVSFLISLASAYAKPILDRCLAWISDGRREKIKIAKRVLEREADKIESTADGAVLASLHETKLVLSALFCTTLCILLLGFMTFPPTPFGGSKPPAEFLLLMPFLLIFACFTLRAAIKKSAVLKIVQKRRDAKRTRQQ